MMKRVFVNPHQSSASTTNPKYHNLLQDYLELQKEYVSKKRKIQVAKQKREILLDEVRFLKQRREYLLIINSQFVEGRPKLQRKEMNYIVNETDAKQQGRMDIGNCIINEYKGRKRKIVIVDKKNPIGNESDSKA